MRKWFQHASDHQIGAVISTAIAIGGFLIWAAAALFDPPQSCKGHCSAEFPSAHRTN